MILMDSREPEEIYQRLLAYNLPVERRKLDVADYIWDDIAVERKTPKDFVQSVYDGRLWRQAVEMANNYSKSLILITGSPIQLDTLVRQNTFLYTSVVFSLIKIGCNVIVIPVRDTAFAIKVMYEKTYKKGQKPKLAKRKAETLEEEVVRIVSQYPLINETRAKILLSHFGTIRNLANASIEDLEKVKGIGKVTARRIFQLNNLVWRD